MAYRVFPFLFLAPLLLVLYYVLASQFVIVKKTFYCSIVLLFTALLNIALNLLMVLKWGMCGVALASIASYLIAIIVASFVLYKMSLFIFTVRMFILITMLIAGNFIWFLSDSFKNIFIVSLAVIIISGIIYFHEVRKIINYIKRKGE